MTIKTNSNGKLRGLGHTLAQPIIVLGLLAGVTAGSFATDVGTASASPRPYIRFQTESYNSASNTYQETVVGGGYTPGGLVWIGIANVQYDSAIGRNAWNYQYGAKVYASPMGFYPFPGGTLQATITLPGNWVGCVIGLSASDQTTGASTAPLTTAQSRRQNLTHVQGYTSAVKHFPCPS